MAKCDPQLGVDFKVLAGKGVGKEMRLDWIEEGLKRYIEDEAQNPNISVVQAISLIGSFHSTLGEQSLGFLYFGAW